MTAERLHTSEALCFGKKPQPLKKSERVGEAKSEIRRNDSRATAHLTLRDLVLRVRWQKGIAHLQSS